MIMSNKINDVIYEKSKCILFNSYCRSATKVLSNLHVCDLEFEGIKFHSSEQLFFWLRLWGYQIEQSEILRCTTPKEVKKRGAELMKTLGVNAVLERDVPLLRLAIRVKYNCCKEFRDFLFSHPTQPIVEYAWWGDTTFGCVDKDENLKYDWDKGYVIGKNVCGRIIMGVRKEVKDCDGKATTDIPECIVQEVPQLLF